MKNFAILYQEKTVKWSFQTGEIDKDFHTTILTFLENLLIFSQTVYQENVATVLLDPKWSASVGIEPIELFVIAITDKIHFIANNLTVTAELIKRLVKIPEDLELNLKAVLSSRGMIAFSNLLSEATTEEETERIYDLIKSILWRIGTEEKISEVITPSGALSLSRLSVPELLQFYHYFRKIILQRGTYADKEHCWAVIPPTKEGKLLLSFKLPDFAKEAAKSIQKVFRANQEQFGIPIREILIGSMEKVINLRFLSGSKYILAVSQPFQVLSDPLFIEMFKKLPLKIQEDLKKPITRYMTHEFASSLRKEGHLTPEDLLDIIRLISVLNNDILFDIPGIGPKRVKFLHQRQIITIVDLAFMELRKKDPIWLKKAKSQVKIKLVKKYGWFSFIDHYSRE